MGDERLELAFRRDAAAPDQRGCGGIGGLLARIAANRREQGELVQRAGESGAGRR